MSRNLSKLAFFYCCFKTNVTSDSLTDTTNDLLKTPSKSANDKDQNPLDNYDGEESNDEFSGEGTTDKENTPGKSRTHNYPKDSDVKDIVVVSAETAR